MGSFLNVCVYRIPNGESIVFPASHCPSCHKTIRLYENLPIVSWLLLRGQCSHCHCRISIQYFIVECVTGIVFVLTWFQIVYQSWPVLVLSSFLMLISLLIVISLIDIRYSRIPNAIILLGCLYAIIIGMVFPATHTFSRFGIYDQKLPILKPWTYSCFENYTAHLSDSFLIKNQLFVLTDFFLGLLVGGGLLLLTAEIGKFLFGSRKIKYDQRVNFSIDRRGLSVSNGLNILWEHIFLRQSDEVTLFGAVKAIEISTDNNFSGYDKFVSDDVHEIKIKEGGVQINSSRMQLTQIDRLVIEGDQWTCPQEVLGMGDVKLVAMIGLFLGPSAILFIITICGCGI